MSGLARQFVLGFFLKAADKVLAGAAVISRHQWEKIHFPAHFHGPHLRTASRVSSLLSLEMRGPGQGTQVEATVRPLIAEVTFHQFNYVLLLVSR